MKERIPYSGGDEEDVHAARHIVCLSRATIRAAKRSYNKRLRRALKHTAGNLISEEEVPE